METPTQYRRCKICNGLTYKSSMFLIDTFFICGKCKQCKKEQLQTYINYHKGAEKLYDKLKKGGFNC